MSMRLLLAVCMLASACTPSEPPKPSVVLIVIDTLRADHLGASGYQKPTSPHLDDLAKRGVRFAGAHSTTSWTLPSVTSILTALYPASHGVEHSLSVLGTEIGTLPESFQRAGYETVAISANPAFVTPQSGLGRGFGAFDVVPSPPPTDPPSPDQMVADATFKKFIRVPTADRVTDHALEWLEHRSTGERPFFLYLHYFDPHAGYFPPPEYAERFGVARDEPLAGRFQWALWRKHTTPDAATPEQLAVLQALYDGEIAFTDAEIGRFLTRLDAVNGTRPLLVVVTSDHGEELGDHHGLQHGQSLWEEVLHVPLIITGTGMTAGLVVSQPVSLVSLWSTLADLTGIQPPVRSEGPSLVPMIRTPSSVKPVTVAADLELVFPGYRWVHTHALIQGRWKLLVAPSKITALHDLQNDPTEHDDVTSLEPGEADLLKAMNRVRVRSVAMRAAVAKPAPELSEEQRERLKALGYLGE
jgi:arylsulfatase A-like enzyme